MGDEKKVTAEERRKHYNDNLVHTNFLERRLGEMTIHVYGWNPEVYERLYLAYLELWVNLLRMHPLHEEASRTWFKARYATYLASKGYNRKDFAWFTLRKRADNHTYLLSELDELLDGFRVELWIETL